MKSCVRCGEIKPLTDFHRRSSSKDGRRGDCKACHLIACAERRKTASWKATRDAYQKTDAYRESQKAYRRTGKGRAATRRGNAVHQSLNPFKYRAKAAVYREIRAGRMRRAIFSPCESLSESCAGQHEHHHDSYRKEDWLNVRVLCRHHHRQWHLTNTPTPYESEVSQ